MHGSGRISDRSPESRVDGAPDTIEGLALLVSAMSQSGLALANGTAGSPAILVKTGQKRTIAWSHVAPTITPDPVRDFRDLADHLHDFHGFLSIASRLLVGNDERGIDSFTWLRMLETSKSTCWKDAEAHSGKGNFQEVAAR